MEPTLQSVTDSSLRWIFVGGKGGVGKTTTSCALAIMMAHQTIEKDDLPLRYKRILIISTDPAHNLSDAFDQKIGKEPTPVAGVDNLMAMEVDPQTLTMSNYLDTNVSNALSGGTLGEKERDDITAAINIFKEGASSLPGIDEVTVFSEIMKQIQNFNFDVVIFDTAPTGHTLRLLGLPQTLSETIDRLFNLKGFASLMDMLSTFVSGATGQELSSFSKKIEDWRTQVKAIQKVFVDPEITTFVCVCIPEFLSVYETERLVQDLVKYNIGCENIVVNQLVLKPESETHCKMCESRQRVQSKYLKQIEELYDGFHIVKMPLSTNEVRGPNALQKFGQFLFAPYDPDVHGYVE